MRHGDYVAARTARDPRFADERTAAAAELRLIASLTERRESLAWSLAELANATGIPEDRLAAIEEGDTITLNELLWLSHALGVSVAIDSDLSIVAQPPLRVQATGAVTRPNTASVPKAVVRKNLPSPQTASVLAQNAYAAAS